MAGKGEAVEMSMEPVRAERAVLSDIPELTALRLFYLAEDLGEIAEADAAAIREALPRYFCAHLDRDLFAYVVRDGGRLAACALLLVTEKPMSPRFLNGKTGTVLNVYTRPDCRRRGCGRAVMEKLLAEAAEMGLCTVELKATDEGVPLYRAVGFTDSTSEYRLMRWRNPERTK